MPEEVAKNGSKLIKFWLIGTILTFLLFVSQVYLLRYGIHIGEAWLWLFQTTFPALILFSVFYGLNKKKLLYVEYSLSKVIVLLIVLYFGYAIFSIASYVSFGSKPIDSLRFSNYGLIPLQLLIMGIVAFHYWIKQKNFVASEAGLTNSTFDHRKSNLLQHTASTIVEGHKDEVLNNLFISYASEDEEWLERIQIHLKPLIRKGKIDIWSNKDISAGYEWQNQIQTALNKAEIALLLVSADFIASDFIFDNEIAILLKQAETKGTVIIPIFIKHTSVDFELEILKIKSLNNPDKPLESLSKSDQELILSELGKVIRAYLN